MFWFVFSLVSIEKVKELAEAQATTVSAKEENPLTMAKYTEVLRKLETFTAIQDSNRMLRDERDSLLNRIKELTERNDKVENELFPLQERNRELAIKTEELTSDNSKLRSEANQWRQRANNLVERSNKNPEEFKRMQNEREHLAKMLTAEKEKIDKYEAEIGAIKQEKNRIETELATVQKSAHTTGEERKKLSEDVLLLKQSNARMTNEIIEIKNKLLQRDDEIKKMVDELNAKEAQLNDSRNKEIQIRKIAKKYKENYMELEGKHNALKAEKAARPLEEQAADICDTNPSQTDKTLKELQTSIAETREQNELLRSENDALSKQLNELEAKHSTALKDLNGNIQTLNEEKKHITRELSATKTQLVNYEQVRTEVDSLKSQNENRIKDLADQDKENKETIARLTRENEALQARLNQLHRQLGNQPGSKPATSSGVIEKSPSDAARTANVKPMAGMFMKGHNSIFTLFEFSIKLFEFCAIC